MKIEEMENNELFRYYAELRIEIDNKYNFKKQLEKEIEARFRDGRLSS